MVGAVNITVAMTGAYTYSPNPGEVGSNSFMFMVNDGLSNSNPATIDVTIYQRPTVGFVDSSSLSVENKTETVLKKLGKKVYHYGSLHILPYKWDRLLFPGFGFWVVAVEKSMLFRRTRAIILLTHSARVAPVAPVEWVLGSREHFGGMA